MAITTNPHDPRTDDHSNETLNSIPGTETATGIALIVLALAILGGAIYYYVHTERTLQNPTMAERSEAMTPVTSDTSPSPAARTGTN